MLYLVVNFVFDRLYALIPVPGAMNENEIILYSFVLPTTIYIPYTYIMIGCMAHNVAIGLQFYIFNSIYPVFA